MTTVWTLVDRCETVLTACQHRWLAEGEPFRDEEQGMDSRGRPNDDIEIETRPIHAPQPPEPDES